MSNRQIYICFFSIFLFSLLLRLVLIDYSIVRVIEADGVSYISDAKGFLDGFDIRNINVVNQPLFPIVIAFFSWFSPDWETAGRMVSIVSGSLIGSFVFLISTSKGNSIRVSIFTGLFSAIVPQILNMSFRVFSDTLNCLLLLVAIWQLIVALKNGNRKNFLFSGFVFSLAYLTRHDSIVPFLLAAILVTCSLFFINRLQKKWSLIFIFLAGFMILSVPYLIYLHSQLDQWVISGRQMAAQMGVAYKTGKINKEEVCCGLTDDFELVNWGTTNTKSRGRERIGGGLISLWLEDPARMAKKTGDNLKIELDVLRNAVPWLVIILVLSSILIQRKKFLANNLPLFVYSSPLLFLYPLFWVDQRHLYHFFIPAFLWAAEGVELLPTVMKRFNLWKRTFKGLPLSEIFKYTVYLMIVVSMALSFKLKEIGPRQLSYLRKKDMGVWISKNSPIDAVIMSRWGRLSFYTDRKTVMFPYAKWVDIEKFMEKNGVTHLVLDESFYNLRPQIRNLLSPLLRGTIKGVPKELSLLKVKRDKFGGMIVYKRN